MNYNQESNLFLGFDLSTQQLKIIVSNENLKHLDTYNVEFDSVFKEKYGIHKGVIENNETGEILSPVLMWLDSIDYVFNEMKNDNFPFDKVKGVSGSGMQHGSIYWSADAKKLLSNLDSNQDLSSQLDDAFSFKTSPNWQDHSTGKEIKDFENAVGGADNLADLTGSRAHYRFTGLQIRKLATRLNPKLYSQTERISLVSSFVASVLLGSITNIEQADACGMNVYDISQNSYNDELLAVAAGVHPKIDGASDKDYQSGVAELKSKLGDINPISYKSIGKISPYFVEKYGFSGNTNIYSFTGDNLATIISLPLLQNDILISLGTSTTCLLITENYTPSSQYHLFKHPTMPNHYMGMICYCNGSLARERIRNSINEKYHLKQNDWSKFNEILDSSKKFDDKLGIYFPLGEIVPNASAQIKRFKLDSNDKLAEVGDWEIEEDVSSIVESQTLSCRLRSGPMLTNSQSKDSSSNLQSSRLNSIYQDLTQRFGELYTDGKKQTFESLTAKPHKIYYVGGASNNLSIIKKMGSILGPTDGNFKVEIPNACALGGAYKASWSFKCEKEDKWIEYNDYISGLFNFEDVDNFKTEENWENYFNGLGMLAKMEDHLNHD